MESNTPVLSLPYFNSHSYIEIFHKIRHFLVLNVSFKNFPFDMIGFDRNVCHSRRYFRFGKKSVGDICRTTFVMRLVNSTFMSMYFSINNQHSNQVYIYIIKSFNCQLENHWNNVIISQWQVKSSSSNDQLNSVSVL